LSLRLREIFLASFHHGLQKALGLLTLHRDRPCADQCLCKSILVNWKLVFFVQGQRLLQLETAAPAAVGGGTYTVATTAPPSSVIAPSAYYMLFAVSNGIPSQAQWVHVG
jgi:hypothetical protein